MYLHSQSPTPRSNSPVVLNQEYAEGPCHTLTSHDQVCPSSSDLQTVILVRVWDEAGWEKNSSVCVGSFSAPVDERAFWSHSQASLTLCSWMEAVYFRDVGPCLAEGLAESLNSCWTPHARVCLSSSRGLVVRQAGTRLLWHPPQLRWQYLLHAMSLRGYQSTHMLLLHLQSACLQALILSNLIQALSQRCHQSLDAFEKCPHIRMRSLSSRYKPYPGPGTNLPNIGRIVGVMFRGVSSHVSPKSRLYVNMWPATEHLW